MTHFHEDKLFKNVGNKDVKILLELIDVNTVKVKIWTKELRLLDPKDYVPDIILELDFENLILELQSTPVDDEFSKRALTFVAVANREKDNNKIMNLMVLSTAEESKTISYQFSEDSVFTYHVISLKDFDYEKIIESVETKIENGDKIEGREIVLYQYMKFLIKLVCLLKRLKKYFMIKSCIFFSIEIS